VDPYSHPERILSYRSDPNLEPGRFFFIFFLCPGTVWMPLDKVPWHLKVAEQKFYSPNITIVARQHQHISAKMKENFKTVQPKNQGPTRDCLLKNRDRRYSVPRVVSVDRFQKVRGRQLCRVCVNEGKIELWIKLEFEGYK